MIKREIFCLERGKNGRGVKPLLNIPGWSGAKEKRGWRPS
jgi:hypothetical protein